MEESTDYRIRVRRDLRKHLIEPLHSIDAETKTQGAKLSDLVKVKEVVSIRGQIMTLVLFLLHKAIFPQG